jgi:cell wall-associated NlpC family hydrolase
VAGLAGTAAADPNPVIPSAAQVAGAQAAVTTAQAQAAAIDEQLSGARAGVAAAQDKAAAAEEAYNGAKVELDRASQESADAAVAASAAQTASSEANLAVSRYAAEVFQGGGSLGQLDVVFGGTGPGDALDRAAGLDAVGAEQARVMREAEMARALAQTTAQAVSEARDRQTGAAAAAAAALRTAQDDAAAAQSAAASLTAQQDQAVVQLAALRQTSVQLESQRQAGLAAQEQARIEAENRRKAEAAAAEAARQAAARAAAQAAAAAAAAESAKSAREAAAAKAAAAAAAAAGSATGSTRTTTPKPAPAPAPAPAPSSKGGASAVIAYARAQLGKPYVWGAAGPDSFDCSGLTLKAWAQAGVSLSHYTGSQWDETARVAIADLQAGDLVFYGSSGPSSEHVGLYIGGGQMIHAPHTGDVVKISSIYYMSGLLPFGGRP